MNRCRASSSKSAVLALLCVVTLCAGAEARLRDDLRGEQLYARECASCHGPRGRGDGPEAIYFTPPPRDLHEGFLRLYETAELVARIRDGQPLDIDVDRVALARRERIVDDIVAHLRRLSDVPWDDVERGAGLWSERCERCHGPFGRPASGVYAGDGKPAVDLAAPDVQRRLGDARLLERAERHDSAAIVLPALPDPEDRRALLAYVRVLSPGLELYSIWCAGCHADDGLGDPDTTGSSDRRSFALDRAHLRAQPAAELRRQVVRMLASQEAAMPHLRHRLSDDQVRTIIDYLRSTDRSPPTPRD